MRRTCFGELAVLHCVLARGRLNHAASACARACVHDAEPAVQGLFMSYTEYQLPSEKVSWKNLLYGLSQAMRGSSEERAALSFSLFDVSGDGAMDSDEVSCGYCVALCG